MKDLRNFLKVLVFFVSLMVLPLFSNPCQAKELQTLKIAYLPIIDLLQLYVGWEKGFFEEEGLKVEGQKARGGAVVQTLVEGGSVDLGWTAVVPLSQAHVKGFDFIFIAPGAFMDRGNRRMCSVVVNKNTPIKIMKDLEGKRIGINSIHSLNHLSILAIADYYGVDTKRMKFLEVNFPMQPAAVREGSVDAASMLEPFVTISVAEGFGREIFNGFYPPEMVERYMVAGWFAKKSAVEKNKEKIERFIKAINKATDFINRNPHLVPEIVGNHTRVKADLARKVTLPKFFTKFYKSDFQAQIDLLAKYGLIKKGYDAREIVTDLIDLR